MVSVSVRVRVRAGVEVVSFKGRFKGRKVQVV